MHNRCQPLYPTVGPRHLRTFSSAEDLRKAPQGHCGKPAKCGIFKRCSIFIAKVPRGRLPHGGQVNTWNCSRQGCLEKKQVSCEHDAPIAMPYRPLPLTLWIRFAKGGQGLICEVVRAGPPIPLTGHERGCSSRATASENGFDNTGEETRLALALDGVVAQLVEHHNGIVGVWGSNPHGSTIRTLAPPSPALS